MYLRNAWYVAAYTSQLEAAPLISLTLADEPIVLYRKRNGEPVALEDRCVHRFAPLSLGRVEGDNLRCMYHGILFEGSGRAVKIPGQDLVPDRACVHSYPVIERSGWLWIWMGEKEKADPALIPPVYGMRNPEWLLNEDQLDYECNHELISANLIDLGHLTWVHQSSFGADETWAETTPNVVPIERGVRVTRWLAGIPPIPRLGKAAEHDRVDHWTQFDFYAPGIFHFYNGLYPVGTAQKYGYNAPASDDQTLIYEHYTQQAVTPMTARTTRYFYTWGPSTRCGNAEHSAIMRKVNFDAFMEDKLIIERQQKIIDLQPEKARHPMLTIHDKSVMVFQRAMQKLMDEERTDTDGAIQQSA